MNHARFLPLFAILTIASGPKGGLDEGQWLPQQVLAMDWSELRARGMELTKEEFWDPDAGGVLSAAVQIGGCTASFVSGEGLLVTNHHCGFSAVAQLSSVERNLLRDGFVAGSREAELPAPGMRVFVVRKIEDVTAKIHAAQAEAETDIERWSARNQAISQLEAEGERQPNTTCHVASFLEGQSYHLYYRTQLTDVRLVYAPPRSVGEFGGEVDNWEWPRHTGDFCFFRAYAAPDGSPRGHDKDNVPYRPDHFLKVSAKGVQEDDLLLILGYPGRTERYLTSVAVQDRQTVTFPQRNRVFSQIMAVLQSVSADDERKALQYTSLLKSLSNVQKNALGMIEGLARNAVVARKLREEAAFTRWVAESPERARAFDGALADVLALDREARQTVAKDTVLGLLRSSGLNPLLGSLVSAVSWLRANEGSDSLQPRGDSPVRRLGGGRLMRDFDTVQKPTLRILLDEARHLPEAQRLRGTARVTSAPDAVTTAALVDELVGQSKMLDAAARMELFEGGLDAISASEDPLIVLARGLAADSREQVERDDSRQGRRLVVGPRWVEAQQKWRGKSFYPDANSTLRVSIASVKSYVPRDGVVHTAHTTVAGVLAKETGKAPFASPPVLLEAAAKRGMSRFRDAALDDVPVCFLSNGDTTGGNSGSPVINGRGELVGLNFDRVFEAVSGDYGWGAARSRNISVDIRYALWIMEQVMPAPHVLAELGV